MALALLVVVPEHSSQAFESKTSAKALQVYDLKAGRELVANNAQSQLPIASITKIATAFAALETLGRDAQVLITDSALAPEGDSGLIVGELWNIVDLTKFMLIVSSNDAARALELAVNDSGGLLAQMNAIARYLGLDQTFFLNVTGLDLSTSLAGAYSSARDVNRLALEFYRLYPDVFTESNQLERHFLISGVDHKARNTNISATSMVGLLASKTGSTDLAGANLCVIFDPEIGRPIVATALGSTSEARFPDTINLIYETMETLSKSL